MIKQENKNQSLYVNLKSKKILCVLFSKLQKKQRGTFLPVVILASVLFLALAAAIITMALSNVKMAELHNKNITAMSVAEAGINYYLWHLAHNNQDYCDGGACVGTTTFGPYVHDYTDQSGKVIGSYELYITPPTGSEPAIVKSVGKVAKTNTTRTIISTIGIPSFTKYTLLINKSEIWVGSGEKVDGSVFVDGNGLRNDGEITGDAFSTEKTYVSGMFGGDHDGIWGSGTFGGAKSFPVPPIDFNQISVDILNLRIKAQSGDGDYYDSSGKKGYHIIFNQDNYIIKTVTKFDNTGLYITQEDTGTIHNYPTRGIIFCKDDVWIEGTINNQQVTVVAADPNASRSQRKRIIIPNNLKFTNYDGKDKIGLITQTDILLTQNAPSQMEIDAAMIAKDGEIRINNYNEHKDHIKVYGSMAHNTGLIWTYDYGGGRYSGYATTETIMDQHNVYNPPPQFPVTGTYAILSWREE